MCVWMDGDWVWAPMLKALALSTMATLRFIGTVSAALYSSVGRPWGSCKAPLEPGLLGRRRGGRCDGRVAPLPSSG